MKNKNDGWLGKAQAAKRLRVSIRTLERYAKEGRIISGTRDGKFGKEAVYDVRSLDAWKEERKHQTSDVVLHEPKVSTSLVRMSDEPLSQAQFLEALRTAITQSLPLALPPSQQVINESQDVRIADKLSLTLKEASRLSGYSRVFLLDAIHKGELKAAIRGRGWNIKRSDLDKWISRLP